METSKRKTKPLIEQFCSVTGASEDVAEYLLDACGGDVQLAIEMHMEEGRLSPAVDAAGSSMDAVRAPIPQTQEILVEDSAYGVNFRGRKRKGRSVFDGFRDFQVEAQQQEEEMIRAGASSSSGLTRTARKTKTLQDLFRPPVDITYKGTFENAREAGTSQGKWLMINIQNVQEFACQALNRDVWSNPAVKALIKEHFIFWQVYHDSDEGEKFCHFYKTKQWPYVAVLDPQTGENLVAWSRIESCTFHDLVSEFLSQHPSIESLSPPSKRAKREDSILDATEDDQLNAAIQASLVDVTAANDEVSTLTDSSSDLETFTDSEEDRQASPVRTRASPNRSSFSSRISSGKDSSGAISKKLEKLRKTSLSPVQKDIIARTKNGRCESPLAFGSDKPCSSKTRNSSPPRMQRDSSPIKCNSPSKSSASPCKKNSPYRVKSSPQKSIDSPKKSASIHNDVHPAVIANRQSLTDGKQSSDSGDCVQEMKDVESDVVNDAVETVESDMSTESLVEMRDYKNYLGNNTDAKVNIMLRLPDGQRERLCIPFSSQLLALVVFASSKGFTQEKYELVAHFPHRQLSQFSYTSSLTEIGLNAQETIFVQKRS